MNKFNDTRYFSNAPKSKVSEAGRKGGLKRRTPETGKAWDEQNKIRDLYVAGMSYKEIARLYKVSYDTIYRILKVNNGL